MISRIKDNMHLLTMICMLIISGYGIISYFFVQQAIEKDAETLKKYVNIGDTSSNHDKSDFSDLWEINPDIIGWMIIEGTKVDYPIMYPGIEKDVDFYLYHNAYGHNKKEGAIFVEPVNSGDFSDELTVVYGHNMKNNTMFGDLEEYVKPEFLNQHKEIQLRLPDDRLKYSVFASVERGNANLIHEFDVFGKSYDRKSLLKYIEESAITFDSEFKDNGGKIIALSTCSNDNRRLVVFGMEKLDIE